MNIRRLFNRAAIALFLRTPLSSRSMTRRIWKAVWLRQFKDWCRTHDCRALPSGWREQFYGEVAGIASIDGPVDYLEFGVYDGRTVRMWAELSPDPGSRFYGFDTFEGLPEEWAGRPVGHFDMHGDVPETDDERVRFIKGLFQDTLPSFLRENDLPRRKVIHVDCDLYSAAIFVLIQLAPLLRDGDLLIFDELSSYMHEFRAFMHFLSAYPVDYKVIHRTEGWAQVAVLVTDASCGFSRKDRDVILDPSA